MFHANFHPLTHFETNNPAKNSIYFIKLTRNIILIEKISKICNEIMKALIKLPEKITDIN